MVNRTSFNQHNSNMRNQGGVNSWAADVDSEIYQNMDNLEVEINQNKNQLNDHEQRLQSNSGQISNHEERLNTQLGSITSIQNDINEKQNQINQIMTTELPGKQTSIDTINNRLVDYEKKMDEYDVRIVNFNQMALDGLAKAYTDMADGEIESEGKNVYTRKNGLKQDRDFWLLLTYIIFGAIIALDVVLVGFKIGMSLQNQTFYSLAGLNVPALTLLYFIVSQYSYYKKLYMEYKNREVVAKSYLGILNNAQNNEHERGIITQIVADTLFTKNVADQGADLPVKEAIRIVERTAESATKVITKKMSE